MFEQQLSRIEKDTIILKGLYPIEGNHESRCSLYQCAFKDGIITREEFKNAQQYYGNLWTYVGD